MKAGRRGALRTGVRTLRVQDISDGQFFESYQLPFGVDVLEAVEKILRDAKVFLSLDDDNVRYQVVSYRRQKAHYDSETYAFLDRNTLVDVLSIVGPAAAGHGEACSDRGRIGAAMMAFLQCANVRIEPCVSLYENPASAQEEVRLFRQADNIDPVIYAQLALGQIDSLPTGCVPKSPQDIPVVDFFRPLTNTQKFQIACLKIAVLDQSSLSNDEKLRHFLQWSFAEFCILAVPTLTAITHFSPHRRSSILKNLGSRNRARALDGVRNAVWDMLTIQQWARNVDQQADDNRIWLLCSRDEALKRIAEVLHCDGESDQALQTIVLEWWGTKQGAELTKLLLSLQSDSGNPKRRVNNPVEKGYLQKLEDDLEREVLEWKPTEVQRS